jgi:hypothetical protein
MWWAGDIFAHTEAFTEDARLQRGGQLVAKKRKKKKERCV